ncbi:STAS domain-containing protein [candidate division KSB1 bacterium]|nr:STAS domain-containing protein [candidate division KSB1 bacterium]NIR69076.1 STAS domain-containing protein [candidate division KSB1 bacterium]NIS25638.1 STAS domain-containing protein [candidate division KSB1 bacterium]NIT72502.1 STAS domain-containing protein [candidate division KSB1 bacterium]NIU26315.1 STAS domain-containing protein [candidate division KSB1 bacterium]
MFEVKVDENGELLLNGRFDASQVEKAKKVFDAIDTSCTVNFKDLDYISSAGLGVLLGTQKRLTESGNALKLINMNKHIRDVFRYAGFDTIFDIE